MGIVGHDSKSPYPLFYTKWPQIPEHTLLGINRQRKLSRIEARWPSRHSVQIARNAGCSSLLANSLGKSVYFVEYRSVPQGQCGNERLFELVLGELLEVPAQVPGE